MSSRRRDAPGAQLVALARQARADPEEERRVDDAPVGEQRRRSATRSRPRARHDDACRAVAVERLEDRVGERADGQQQDDGQNAHDRAARGGGQACAAWAGSPRGPAHRRPTCRRPADAAHAERSLTRDGIDPRPPAQAAAALVLALVPVPARRLRLRSQRRNRRRSPPCAGGGAPRARGARARVPRSARPLSGVFLAAEQAHVRCRRQVVLEQHRGCARVLGPAAAAGCRDRRGEALVVEIDGHSHPTTQPLGKITRCHRLLGIGAAQAHR